MNKDIFDEAMNTHLPKIVNQANERKLNNEVVVNRWGLETIEKALKLGKLYKELSKLIVAVPLFEGSKMICYKTKYRNDIKYTNILNKIKELEE